MNTIINPGQLLEHRVEKLRITGDSPNSVSQFASNIPKVGPLKQVANAVSATDDNVFEVQINPEKYERSLKINTQQQKTEGTKKDKPNFHRVEPDTLNLTFILDGTGVIPPSPTDPKELAFKAVTEAADFAKRSIGQGGFTDTTYVSRRLKQLKNIVYQYIDEKHESPTVIINWGDIETFKGRLVNMKVTYTLFNPNGSPLRAEVNLSFIEDQSDADKNAKANGDTLTQTLGSFGSSLLSSPDLTHTRTVTDSDTLPLLCEDIYRNASYYWQVARANNLTQFRKLSTNTELVFPPFER